MIKYTLKSNTGEKIAYTNANSLDEAKTFFSIMKNLSINELLRIFIVE